MVSISASNVIALDLVLWTQITFFPLMVTVIVLRITLPCSQNGQYHLATVGGLKHLIHRYEGALNGIYKAVVLLSYPNHFWQSKCALCVHLFGLKAFWSGNPYLLHPLLENWRTRLSSIKCIWVSNLSWFILQRLLTAHLSFFPWLIIVLPYDAFLPLSSAIFRFRAILCKL